MIAVVAAVVGSACGGSTGATADAGAGIDGSTGPRAGEDAGCDGVCVPATAIAAGWDYTCALLASRRVACWGDNFYGELGIGTRTGPQTCVVPSEDPDGQTNYPCSTTPIVVPGLSDVTALAAGEGQTCALLSGGTVVCWGWMYGQPGDVSTTPVAVPGLSGVTALAAGLDYTCALLSGGTVECWGDNSLGSLGDGTTTGPETCSGNPCSTTPVVVQGLSDVTALAAGGGQTCALLSGGTVACWGYNEYGQIGAGPTSGPQECGGNPDPCSTMPMPVAGLSGVTALAAGSSHTCALLSDGTVACWGLNSYGELGDGTSTGPLAGNHNDRCSTTPVAVSGLSGVTAITAGGEYSCALLSDGTVACWGASPLGELGDGTSTGPQTCSSNTNSQPATCSTTPVAVSNLRAATAISAGGAHACAVLSRGVVECWGDNAYGALGIGESAGPETCSGVPNLPCSTTPQQVSGL